MTLQGMPDLHKGPSSSPVGCVFITSASTIYPGLIGGDIGCGMSLFLLPSFPGSSSLLSTPQRLASQLVNIDGPHANPLSVLEAAGIAPAGPEFDRTLGTIGGGNHFAEIQVVDEVLDEAAFAALDMSE